MSWQTNILDDKSASPRYRAATRMIGQYYGPEGTRSAAAATTLSRCTFAPILLQKGTYDSLRFNVTATGAGSATRLGIYADLDGGPGKLLLDAGTVDSSTATGMIAKTISFVVKDGQRRVWLASCPQGGAAPSTVTLSLGEYMPEDASGNPAGGVILNGVAGAFADTTPGAVTVSATVNLGVSIRRSA